MTRWKKLLRAAFVIARRDFTATVFSRAFIFFLLGPLFPLLMGGIFGGITSSVAVKSDRPTVAVVASVADFAALEAARGDLARAADPRAIVFLVHARPEPDPAAQRARLLASDTDPIVGVLEGGIDSPRLTGSGPPEVAQQLGYLIDRARAHRAAPPGPPTELSVVRVDPAATSQAPGRSKTAFIAQGLLFLLTLLLSTMLLSQLIDEKSNKIIEILAAAVPVEAIFVGELFAMLALSLFGIAVWTAAGAAAVATLASGGVAQIPAPAIGWPAFLALSFIYFSMSYLLLGAVFLSIGAQASTAREVQTLSMPVTMIQVLVFALSATASSAPGSVQALVATVFPLSSPFVMLARAAEHEAVLPHLAAIAWQGLWVAVILVAGARLFRRSVLKSGPQRKWWRRART